MDEYIERGAALKAIQPKHAPAINSALAAMINSVPAADVVEVVRCRDCIHRPSGTGVNHDVKFPDDECPCKCPDTWYSWMPPDDWYCADGKRKDGGKDNG